jgi:hypothetical protein
LGEPSIGPVSEEALKPLCIGGNRKFESISLQQRVRCELDLAVGSVPTRHLRRVGLDLMLASLAPESRSSQPSPSVMPKHFIEVSGDLTIIQASTVTAANLARDFRNLIHPGKAARTGQSCDRATARSALAALDHVVRDLTP